MNKKEEGIVIQKLIGLKDDIKDIKERIKGVDKKQTFTNGKVRKFEIWKGRVSGSINAASAIIIVAVLPMSIYFYKDIKNDIKAQSKIEKLTESRVVELEKKVYVDAIIE